VQDELKARPELLLGGVLRVDESAEEKAGDHSAGAGKQYNGRMGKKGVICTSFLIEKFQ
jgi:hypothetical protein